MNLNVTNITAAALANRNVFKFNPILYSFFLFFNLIVCCEVIGILGIVGNILNMYIFYRQGFGDSVTVTLTALAVSDIVALVTQQGINIIFPLSLMKYDLGFTIVDIMIFFFSLPHGYCLRASGFITAFAALERCISVVMPMSVRLIFTKKLAVIVNLSIFLTLSMYLFPNYYTGYLGFKAVRGTNKTYLGVISKQNEDEVLRVSYPITDLMLPYLAFIIIIVCSIITITQLKSKAKWRATVASFGKRSDQDSSKENKTTKMLVVISIIFVVCMIPYSTLLTALSIVRDLKVNGIYFDISAVCYSFVFLTNTFHCSFSIIVYFKMSSIYRSVAQGMMKDFKAKVKLTGHFFPKRRNRKESKQN